MTTVFTMLRPDPPRSATNWYRHNFQMPSRVASRIQVEPRVAVCLLPGTELAFENEVECDASFRFLPTRKSTHKVARFRQVNLNRPAAHHDALEFPDGKIVLVTDLCEGQHATVLQLPSTGRPAIEQGEQEVPQNASLIA